MAALARTIYSAVTPELLEKRFRTPGDAERHLLSGFLRDAHESRPGDRSRWGPDRARAALGYLARHLEQRGGSDLAWWEAGTTLPLTQRMLTVEAVRGALCWPVADPGGAAQILSACQPAYDSPMSSHSEPQAETLTAEIRVLQAGSKPVTLSAARQLDDVDPARIKPFGRVRIDTNPGRMVEVTGSADGALARSSATASERTCPGYANQGTLCRENVRPGHLGVNEYHGAEHKRTKCYPSRELYEAWLALPLIILAGLR